MMPRRRLPVIGLIAAAIVCVSAAFAGENISHSPAWESTVPRAAFDSEGNLYVVWAEFYGNNSGDIFFTKYTKSTQTWSTPFNVSNSRRAWSTTIDVCGIAVDDANLVWIVWTEQSVVRLRTLAGSQWGAAGSVGAGAALQGAKVAATGQGDCYIVWWGNDGVVRARSRVNRVWETARVISTVGRRSKFPDVAAGSNGVIATWVEKKGTELYQAAYVVRFRKFGSTWSSPKPVHPQSIAQQHAVVEFLDGIKPQVVFTPLTDPSRYVAHSAWSGEGFSAPQQIGSEQMIHYPSLAERTGRMIAVWQVGPFGNGRGIYYNEYSGGEWQGEMAVPSSAGGTYCDVAIDSDGYAAIVWDSDGEIMAQIAGGATPPPPNIEPVAEFSFLPATGSAPLTVNFDASASYDPDGTIARYDWIFGDGNADAGKTVTHTFATPGTYTNTLTVVDNVGAANSKSKSIEVINLAPVPGFTITSPFNIVTVTVSFDASSAYDPDGSIVQYDWLFGDGVTAQGKNISRVYTLPGTFSIKLTVTDNFSKQASLTKTFILLALQAPLNIRWESFSDVSLFQSRIVTDVQWEANPANDAIAPIVKYRVFRKEATDASAAYRLTAETDASTFFWRDDDVTTAGQYVYTVTSMDAAGHESLMPSGSAANSQKRRSGRRLQGDGSLSIRR
jgi:PKD repeat protein